MPRNPLLRRVVLVASVLLVSHVLKAAGAAQAEPPIDRTTLDELLARSADDGAAAVGIGDLPEAAQRHYEDAVDFEAEGKFDAAAESLDAALREARAYPYELLELLARVKFRQGRIGESRVAAELAGRLRPGVPDVSYLLGKLALEQSLTEVAIGHFLRAIRDAGDNPSDPRAIASLYELGCVLESSHQAVAAAQAFTRFDLALADAPDELVRAPELAPILEANPRGLVRRAIELFLCAGQMDDAVRAAEEVRDARRGDSHARRVLVETLLEAGRADDAATLAFALIADDGTGPLALATRAAHAAGRLDAWVNELEGRAASPADAAFVARVAQSIDRLELNGKSLPLWQGLARANPDHTVYAWKLAAAQKSAGDLANAISTLVRLYEQSSDKGASAAAEPPVGPLMAWTRAARSTPALEERFGQVAAGRDAYSSVVHALAAMAVGDDQKAETLFGVALEQRPEVALGYIGRALLNLRRARWDDALRDARALAARDPGSSLAQWLAAEAHAGLDQYDEARSAYKRALKIDPDNAEFLLALARLERRTGDLLAAQRFLQEAWTADPTCGEALEELVSSYLEGGKLDLARSALDEAEDADVPLDAMRRARTLLRFAPDLTSERYLAELRRQLDANPSDHETAFALASSLFALDRYEEVADLSAKIEPRDDQMRERLDYLRARLYLRQLDPARAVETLAPLAERYPNRRATLAALAAACAADFRLEEARAIYARLLELSPEPAQREQVRRLWIGSLVDFMDFDAAVARLDQWIADDPNDAALGDLKLEVLRLARRGDEAIELARSRLEPLEQQFNRLIDEYRAAFAGGGAAPARLGAIEKELRELSEPVYARREALFDVLLAFERFEDLEAELRRWQEREPGQAQLRAWSIEAALASKRPDDALAMLRDMNPQTAADLARAVGWRAQALVMQNKTEDAVRDLTNLLKEPPIRANPRLLVAMRRALVRVLVEDRDYQQAVRLTEEWLVEAEKDEAMQYELLTLQRSIFLEAERHADHVRVAEKLLALEPLDPALNNDLGYTLIERGQDLERATEMIRRAVAAEPLNPAYLDSLAWAHYQRGAFEPARQLLRRAVMMRAGQDAVVYDHLGDTEFRLGDRASAAASWEKALALLEERKPDDRRPSDTDLLAAVRRKLAALSDGEPPAVAPSAAEHEHEGRP